MTFSAAYLQYHLQFVHPVSGEMFDDLSEDTEALGLVEAPGVGVVPFDAKDEPASRGEPFEAGEEQSFTYPAALRLGEDVDRREDHFDLGRGIPIRETHDLGVTHGYEEGAGGDTAFQGYVGVGQVQEPGSHSFGYDVAVGVLPRRSRHVPYGGYIFSVSVAYRVSGHGQPTNDILKELTVPVLAPVPRTSQALRGTA